MNTDGSRPGAASKISVGSTAQWEAAGVSRKKLNALVVTGELLRMRHGVYAPAEVVAKSAEDPSLAHALLVASANAASVRPGVASHQSAARIHGIELLHPPPDDTVTVTMPPGNRTGRRRRARIVVHSAALPSGHLTRRHDVPVTTPARTVADIARTSTFMEGVVAAESAYRQQLTSRGPVRLVLADCGRWPGIGRARQVIDFSYWLSESVLESCARVVFREHELPEPEQQVPIFGLDGRRIGRSDFCWEKHRTVAESDGMAKYQAHDDLRKQYKRDRRMEDAGWEVAHFSWQELFGDPALVIARIRAAFERARHRRATPRPAPGTRPQTT